VNALVRGLMWPVVTLLVVGGSHLVAEAIRPGLKDVIGPAVVAPIYLAVGAWGAFATRRAGGGWIHGVVGGAILGVMPLALQIVGFGLILGRDGDAVLTSGLFGLFAMTWGGAIGSGVAGSMLAAPASAAAPVTAPARA
jgi:hypothetical protein